MLSSLIRYRTVVALLRKRPWVALTVVSILIVVLSGLGLMLISRDEPVPVNNELPVELSDLTLRNLENEVVEFSHRSSRVRVIGIFASWCPYCREHLVVLSQFARTHSDVEVVAVNRAEPYEVARAYLTDVGADNLTLLLDPDDAYYKSVGGRAMPEIVIADTRGSILTHLRGPISSEKLEEAYLSSVQ